VRLGACLTGDSYPAFHALWMLMVDAGLAFIPLSRCLGAAVREPALKRVTKFSAEAELKSVVLTTRSANSILINKHRVQRPAHLVRLPPVADVAGEARDLPRADRAASADLAEADPDPWSRQPVQCDQLRRSRITRKVWRFTSTSTSCPRAERASTMKRLPTTSMSLMAV